MRTPAFAKPVHARGTRTVAGSTAPQNTPVDPDHHETIVRSHGRSAALGVSRVDHPDHSHIGRADLAVSLDRNRRLHEHAAPVMEMLREQIARTESMVVLTDTTGIIIHAVGDDEFLDRANKVALRPGANWSEGAKGTNAVGTALIEETPTRVHADEHYLHANNFLTCSAAPILDPRGNMLGVLDVSGDFRSYHKHTLALVRMSARMIENRWLTVDFSHALRLHFHSQAEFIGTLMECIVAVGEDGRIIGANRGALEQLGMSGAALRMQTVTSMFGTTVAQLVDHCRARVATPIVLKLPNGSQFSGFARCNWPIWAAPGNEATAAPPPPRPGLVERVAPAPAPAAASALARLRTGDAHVNTLIDKVRRVLDRDIPILILGETGTGKELLARAIHADSARGSQPFVAVNCASIPDTLIEAELFGYEEGAFTGARRRGAPGKIVQANGGTVFLDEIGDMPLALQAHLLRVLQERQVTPLGSTRSVAVDVAIICATHRNLREMIEQKAFREDLYYRLNGLAVRLPALRERSDLMPLVRRIFDRESGGRQHHLAADVAAMFEAYAWPGNVRQLFHVLRTACVMAGPEAAISRHHLPDDFLEEVESGRAQAAKVRADTAAPLANTPTPPAPIPDTPSLDRAAAQSPEPNVTLDDLELLTIRRVLDSVGGNISEASKRLGISRNTIYRKLRWNQPGGG